MTDIIDLPDKINKYNNKNKDNYNKIINHLRTNIEPILINDIKRSIENHKVTVRMLLSDIDIDISNELNGDFKMPNKYINIIKDIQNNKDNKRLQRYMLEINELLSFVNDLIKKINVICVEIIRLIITMNERKTINDNIINKIKKLLGYINKSIDKLKKKDFNINFAIKTNNNNKTFLNNYSTILFKYDFDNSINKYKFYKKPTKLELEEKYNDDMIIQLHNNTRKYNCFTTLSSLEIILDEIIKNNDIYIKTEQERDDGIIKLSTKLLCQGMKCKHINIYVCNICNNNLSSDKYNYCETCNKEIDINTDELISKSKKCNIPIDLNTLLDRIPNDYKIIVNNKLKHVIKELFKLQYGFDGYIQCPNDNCKDYFGFVSNEVIDEIYNKTLDTRVIRKYYKCNNCNSNICSQCNKIHIDSLCIFDNEEPLEDPHTFKRCPNKLCRIITEKIADCNHITCTNCHIHWCWGCGDYLNPLHPYNHTCNGFGGNNQINDNNQVNNQVNNNDINQIDNQIDNQINDNQVNNQIMIIIILIK